MIFSKFYSSLYVSIVYLFRKYFNQNNSCGSRFKTFYGEIFLAFSRIRFSFLEARKNAVLSKRCLQRISAHISISSKSQSDRLTWVSFFQNFTQELLGFRTGWGDPEMEILSWVRVIDISFENQAKNEHRFYGRLNARTRVSFLDDKIFISPRDSSVGCIWGDFRWVFWQKLKIRWNF